MCCVHEKTLITLIVIDWWAEKKTTEEQRILQAEVAGFFFNRLYEYFIFKCVCMHLNKLDQKCCENVNMKYSAFTKLCNI